MSAALLLSAALIVRDEQEMLPRCLDSLRDVVDEIVVVDTGSTDRTVEIARAAGARVHHAAWRDDFGWARNEALRRCRGRWVLVVDADEEVVVTDPAAFRRHLRAAAVDAFLVRIHNLQDRSGSVSVTHDPIRLLRRDRFTFEGRIHERPVATGPGRPTAAASDHLQIRHHGYVADVVTARGKIERNLRLATAAWEADRTPAARLEVARILSTTDRHDETLVHLDALRADAEAALDGPAGPSQPTNDAAAIRTGDAAAIRTDDAAAIRISVLQLGAQVHLRAGRPEASLSWAEALAADAAPTAFAAQLHAEALTSLGRVAEALDVLDAAPDGGDVAGVHRNRTSSTPTSILRARLLLTLERHDEAVELLVAIAADASAALWPPMLGLLADRGELARAVAPFFEGAERLGPARPHAVLAALRTGPVEVADAGRF